MISKIESDGLSDNEILSILRNVKVIAVVGASNDPSKPAHYVPKFLKEKGYRIVPVNPFAEKVLDEKAYKSLMEIPFKVDVVVVFRPSKEVLPIAEQAIGKAGVLWMQEGIYSREAAEKARSNGLKVVWNRCIMKEYVRLMGGKPRTVLK
ncbi:MAG: CoA-binding protein [Candidatus Methanomethylicia archaeon]